MNRGIGKCLFLPGLYIRNNQPSGWREYNISFDRFFHPIPPGRICRMVVLFPLTPRILDPLNPIFSLLVSCVFLSCLIYPDKTVTSPKTYRDRITPDFISSKSSFLRHDNSPPADCKNRARWADYRRSTQLYADLQVVFRQSVW